MFNVGQKWNTDGDQKYILHILHRAQVLILNVLEYLYYNFSPFCKVCIAIKQGSVHELVVDIIFKTFSPLTSLCHEGEL